MVTSSQATSRSLVPADIYTHQTHTLRETTHSLSAAGRTGLELVRRTSETAC
jgi:hypothetical protein